MIKDTTRSALEVSIQASCNTLRLTSAIPEYMSEEGNIKQIEFLDTALKREVDERAGRRSSEALKKAKFPSYKTFEGYDFKNVKLPPALSREDLENVAFIDAKQNLVLYGPVGVGKTHLATAIGIRACKQGYSVRFYPVTDLVLKLADARKKGTLEKVRRSLNSIDLLILDEWGYVPIDRDGSQLLFRVISDCYENRSLLLTTNLEFSKWGTIFTDDQMAAAMIDRLVHHGHLILFEGNSSRMEHALMKQTARQLSKEGP